MNRAITKTDIPARNKVSQDDYNKMLAEVEVSFSNSTEQVFDIEKLVLEFANLIPKNEFNIGEVLEVLKSSNLSEKKKVIHFLSTKVDDNIPSYETRKTLTKIKSLIL
jgi:hypothetical protein